MKNEKCVLIVDEQLPQGLIANTAAILGITLGKQRPDVVGEDIADADGREHLGIIEFPVPILRAAPEAINELRNRLYSDEYSDICVVDFSDLAQSCKTYGEYLSRLSAAHGVELQYFGLALIGPKKPVNSLTGSLPLLR